MLGAVIQIVKRQEYQNVPVEKRRATDQAVVQILQPITGKNSQHPILAMPLLMKRYSQMWVQVIKADCDIWPNNF